MIESAGAPYALNRVERREAEVQKAGIRKIEPILPPARSTGGATMDNFSNGLTKEIERLRAENKELLEALKKAAAGPLEVRAIMESNGIVIDNLKNKMQKFAFTLYTMIVETATEAEDLIARGEK